MLKGVLRGRAFGCDDGLLCGRLLSLLGLRRGLSGLRGGLLLRTSGLVLGGGECEALYSLSKCTS